MKGGISQVAPRPPKGALQSLPPILRITDPIPTTAYSKAPRGLFVLPRVGRIFTASSISPSPSLRQRSSRYAIRAGRNLPDKEFRYLRHACYSATAEYIFALAGPGHFCLTPHVAMGIGLYLHSVQNGVNVRRPGVQSLRIPSALQF